MENKFTFKSLSVVDVPLMHQWFNLPHVQKFYSLRQWTEDQVLEKLKPYITGYKPVLGFIVLMNEKPKCYEKLNFQSHSVIDSEDALGRPVKLNLMILKR